MTLRGDVRRRELGSWLPPAGLAVTVLPGLVAALLGASSWFSVNLSCICASSISAFACTRTARRGHDRFRTSWAAFAVTMVLWATADLIWLLGGEWSFEPSLSTVADFLYLVGLLPIGLGLLLYPLGSWEPGAHRRLLLDTVVLGGGLLLTVQLLVLDDLVSLTSGNWNTFLAVVYPITDVVMFSLASLLVLRTAGRPRLELVLLAGAFLTWVATDSSYGLVDAHGGDLGTVPINLGYVVGPFLLAAGALVAARTGPQQQLLRRHATGQAAAVLPDLFALAGTALAVLHGPRSATDWVLVAVVLSGGGLRQLVRSADNQSLHHTLERRVEDRTSELRTLAQRHEHLLETVGEGIVSLDASGVITFANPTAATLLGWPAGALEGRDACLVMCAEEHEQCVLDLVVDVGTAVRQSTTTYRRKDGSVVPVELTSAPDGHAGSVVVFRDISVRMAVETVKREFMTAIGHELRTPLSAIHGSLEMLADGDAGELPSVAHTLVEAALHGSERLTRLVNDVIDIERLESGTFTVVPVAQPVEPLITSTVNVLQSLADRAGVVLEAGSVVGVGVVDADRIVQALTNLVGNAVKFTPSGGRVEVGVRPAGDELVFEVHDQGRGIPTAEIDAIFDRFHQVHEGDSREKGGTGLGLAITKSIVERHGGRIWAESVPGRGSVFRFTVPGAVDLRVAAAS